MAWVKSEYAPELAVLSTWLVALLPWSGAVLPIEVGGRQVTVVVIRFLYFRLQYIFGISFGEQERPFLWVVEAPAFNQTLTTASWVWVGAAVLSLVPLALSVAYYVDEDAHEAAMPVDPVRLQGALLALLGVGLAAATLLFWDRQPVTIPVGTALTLVFGSLLLTVDRTDDEGDGEE
ncbi:DUF7549 family protein [Halomicrobium katesii]|uniref:DUF7549 family protein n=1 Tax=Halomicrobium katesii TaxID=437163 RepID=UPI000373BE20|nr:hypothetical protein [Halomicrobium katesii]